MGRKSPSAPLRPPKGMIQIETPAPRASCVGYVGRWVRCSVRLPKRWETVWTDVSDVHMLLRRAKSEQWYESDTARPVRSPIIWYEYQSTLVRPPLPDFDI